MARYTEQQIKEFAERNSNIAERYCNMMEQQPLATAASIINRIAQEYGLTPQRIGGILREQGIETATPKTTQQ